MSVSDRNLLVRALLILQHTHLKNRTFILPAFSPNVSILPITYQLDVKKFFLYWTEEHIRLPDFVLYDKSRTIPNTSLSFSFEKTYDNILGIIEFAIDSIPLNLPAPSAQFEVHVRDSLLWCSPPMMGGAWCVHHPRDFGATMEILFACRGDPYPPCANKTERNEQFLKRPYQSTWDFHRHLICGNSTATSREMRISFLTTKNRISEVPFVSFHIFFWKYIIYWQFSQGWESILETLTECWAVSWVFSQWHTLFKYRQIFNLQNRPGRRCCMPSDWFIRESSRCPKWLNKQEERKNSILSLCLIKFDDLDRLLLTIESRFCIKSQRNDTADLFHSQHRQRNMQVSTMSNVPYRPQIKRMNPRDLAENRMSSDFDDPSLAVSRCFSSIRCQFPWRFRSLRIEDQLPSKFQDFPNGKIHGCLRTIRQGTTTIIIITMKMGKSTSEVKRSFEIVSCLLIQ